MLAAAAAPVSPACAVGGPRQDRDRRPGRPGRRRLAIRLPAAGRRRRLRTRCRGHAGRARRVASPSWGSTSSRRLALRGPLRRLVLRIDYPPVHPPGSSASARRTSRHRRLLRRRRSAGRRGESPSRRDLPGADRRRCAVPPRTAGDGDPGRRRRGGAAGCCDVRPPTSVASGPRGRTPLPPVRRPLIPRPGGAARRRTAPTSASPCAATTDCLLGSTGRRSRCWSGVRRGSRCSPVSCPATRPPRSAGWGSRHRTETGLDGLSEEGCTLELFEQVFEHRPGGG